MRGLPLPAVCLLVAVAASGCSSTAEVGVYFTNERGEDVVVAWQVATPDGTVVERQDGAIPKSAMHMQVGSLSLAEGEYVVSAQAGSVSRSEALRFDGDSEELGFLLLADDIVIAATHVD